MYGRTSKLYISCCVILFSLFLFAFAPLAKAQDGATIAAPEQPHTQQQGDGHLHEGHSHGTDGHDHADAAHGAPTHAPTTAHGHGAAGGHAAHAKADSPDLGAMIMNHVTDANEFHVAGHLSIPLPCIVYHKERGFEFFLSNVFEHGHKSYNGYVMNHGVLNAIDVAAFPSGSADVHVHEDKASKQIIATHNGTAYPASRKSFYDFSITKVVFTMLLTVLIMLLLFPSVARAYGKRSVPKGLQSFFEPIILFVREDIAKPNLGKKYEKFMPYLLTVFFFIWINNLLGLIPFFPGGGNVMGNIAVTMTLAVFTFVLININGTKTYWGHIFNPPGVQFPINLIMILIEFLSIFIKPFALMIRLFANITAGHIIILSLVGIIFIAGKVGGTGAGFGASVIAGAFMLFMNVLELFVAALQAYIFTTLSAVFIGQALEDHSHHPAEDGGHH